MWKNAVCCFEKNTELLFFEHKRSAKSSQRKILVKNFKRSHLIDVGEKVWVVNGMD